MGEVTIDQAVFTRRLKKLYAHWEEQPATYGNASALWVVVGAASDDLRYLKSIALHLWLFGYELPDTIMCLTHKEVHVLTSQKKVSMLQGLAGPCEAEVGRKLVLHVKPKAEDGSVQLQELVGVAQGSPLNGEAAVLGSLPRDKHDGLLAAAANAAAAGSGLAQVDVSAGLAALLASKDASEVLNVKKAALLAGKVMKEWVVPKVTELLDKGKRIKHSKLSEQCEEVIQDPSKVNVKLKAENVDAAYPPVFQSGLGRYDLRVSTPPDDNDLAQEGVVLVALGTRYSSYCANISRVFVVNGTKSQEAQYEALLAAQEAVIKALKPGAQLSAAYDAAVAAIKAKGQEALLPSLSKNVGFGMGLEFRESANVLGPKSEGKVVEGGIFNVCVGFANLQAEGSTDPSQNYALQVADTVVVGSEVAEVVTGQCPKSWDKISYEISEEDEEEDGEVANGAAAAPVPQRKTLRSDDPTFKSAEQLRKEKQEMLLKQKNEETLRRLTAQAQGGSGAQQNMGRKISEVEAYRNINDIPPSRDLLIQVDSKSEAVLLPIYGVLVPFHITTIKNVSCNSEGASDHVLVRVTFNFGPAYEPTQRFPNLTFLKELTFRSSDPKHASKVAMDIRLLRSNTQQRDRERAERATLVAQEKLVRGKRVFKLPDLWMRPAFPSKGRKAPGVLEAHQNGFRYSTPKGEVLDVMYRNIRFAFFQPAENEMVTILHLHLHHPIMVGNKKSKDVQFYAEVMETVQTLDGGRRNMYDPDEIEEEQRERERRNRINGEFQQFVKRVAEVWEKEMPDINLEWDIPYRELGFSGVPHRSTVYMMPSSTCLVELTEMPFTVIPLDDIEIVNLERVGFNLKNFDMAIVWKDFNKDVLRIDAIPTKSLDAVKEWLSGVSIKYYESKLNLQWRPILKHIQADPEGFVKEGGWDFLNMEKSDEEDDEGEESEDYAPSGSGDDGGGGGSDDDESDYSGSDDGSLVTEGDDDEDAEEEDEDEDAMDWDELEEEAKKADRARGNMSDDSEDERSAKKKRKGDGGGGGGGGAGGSRKGAAPPPAKRRK